MDWDNEIPGQARGLKGNLKLGDQKLGNKEERVHLYDEILFLKSR